MTKRYADFITVREEYNSYKLENGVTLRLKIPVTSIYNETINGKVEAKIGTATVSRVEIPDDFDTSNLELTEMPITDKDIIKELQIIEKKEGVNIYEIEKSLLIHAVHLVKVFATGKKNKDGEPMLRFNYEAAIAAVDKPWVEGSQVGVKIPEKNNK